MQSPANHPAHDREAVGWTLEWYACQFPERPHDQAYTAYWTECDACMIALKAAALHFPGHFSADIRSPCDPYGYVAFNLASSFGYEHLP